MKGAALGSENNASRSTIAPTVQPSTSSAHEECLSGGPIYIDCLRTSKASSAIGSSALIETISRRFLDVASVGRHDVLPFDVVVGDSPCKPWTAQGFDHDGGFVNL